MNKGLFQLLILFELQPMAIIENIFVNILHLPFSTLNLIFHRLLDIYCSGSKMVSFSSPIFKAIKIFSLIPLVILIYIIYYTLIINNWRKHSFSD